MKYTIQIYHSDIPKLGVSVFLDKHEKPNCELQQSTLRQYLHEGFRRTKGWALKTNRMGYPQKKHMN